MRSRPLCPTVPAAQTGRSGRRMRVLSLLKPRFNPRKVVEILLGNLPLWGSRLGLRFGLKHCIRFDLLPDHRLVVVVADAINQILRSRPKFDALSIRINHLLDVLAGLIVDRLKFNKRHAIADHVAQNLSMRIFSIPPSDKILGDLLLIGIGFYKI